MLRVRATRHGISWFDVFHPEEGQWYLAKNNLNFVTRVDGKWENSEIERLLPDVEVARESATEITLRYRYAFPNGAKIYADLVLREGEPAVRYTVHEDTGSAEIEGFQWHITFGQAEAVDSLDWQGRKVVASALPEPFPGGSLELQYMEWLDDIEVLDFTFRGRESVVDVASSGARAAGDLVKTPGPGRPIRLRGPGSPLAARLGGPRHPALDRGALARPPRWPRGRG
jgi:hypothetical protein